MTIHELKTWPEPFESVLAGAKRHEVRKFDRDYQVGDTLYLREWLPGAQGGYTGREIRCRVTCVTKPGTWGLPDDIGVMSIETTQIIAKPSSEIESLTGPLRVNNVSGAIVLSAHHPKMDGSHVKATFSVHHARVLVADLIRAINVADQAEGNDTPPRDGGGA